MKKVAFVLLITGGSALLPANAFAAGCLETAAHCFHEAATRDTWLSRTLAALDCEIELAGCVRRVVIGR